MAKQKSELRETLSTIIWAVGIALVLRTFLFQPFHIPSGSMLPGLTKGDYIITSKYSVGYGRYAAAPLPFPGKEGRIFEREPERGDVLVFRPDGDDKNFIKRLVGLPGDKLQMQQGRLFINGEPAGLERIGEETFADRFNNDVLAEIWQETFPEGHSHIIYDSQKNSPSDNTGIFTVPAGHYFMMGDNRDNSGDSRVAVRNGGAGNIPASNIIGKAEIVLLSVNDDFVIYKPWTWANMRGDRFFKRIK
jgi:signal peptidase I